MSEEEKGMKEKGKETIVPGTLRRKRRRGEDTSSCNVETLTMERFSLPLLEFHRLSSHIISWFTVCNYCIHNSNESL